MSFRTDRHNNPAAITTEVARQGGLDFGTDYTRGDSFKIDQTVYWTAELHGDPIALTIKAIDKIGYVTGLNRPRWTYINIPKFVWAALTMDQKRDVVGYHYQHEGGVAMKELFPNYGKI